MNVEKRYKRMSLRVSEDFKNRIEQRAEEENRNLSNFIVNVLTLYLNEIDEAKLLLSKNQRNINNSFKSDNINVNQQ
jgi:uncharacterized protein (DUF1778 family)